jgi:hypothetical protein
MATRSVAPDPEERWLLEWVEQGLEELSRYLEKQAAFEAYCRSRHATHSS